MSETLIKINIDDWRDEALKDEEPIESIDDILSRLERGEHTNEIVRKYLFWREAGNADDGVLRPNKLLLLSGGMVNVSQIAKRQRHEVETKDGQIFMAQDYVGAIRTIADDDEDLPEQSYVHFSSRQAQDRAKQYLENIVPGHIRNRLITIYESGGDVKTAAMLLKETIDQMVDELI